MSLRSATAGHLLNHPSFIAGFRDRAEQAAFETFCQFIDIHLRACPSRPLGLDDASARSYTLGVTSLQMITVALESDLLENSMRPMTIRFLLSVMPRLVDWVRNIVKHEVLTDLTGREVPELFVTRLLSGLLKDPELRNHTLEIAVVPEEGSAGAQAGYFISETLLNVLLHHVSFPSQQWRSQICESWYHNLAYINALADEPACKEEIIEGLKLRPKEIVAVFNLLATDSVQAIQSSSTIEQFNKTLTNYFKTYAALPFLQDDIFRHELLRTHHVRWLCTTMRSTIIRSTALTSRTPGGTVDSSVEESEMRAMAEKCLLAIGLRLKQFMLQEGWWIIKEVFEHDVLVDVFKYMRSSSRRSRTVTEHYTVLWTSLLEFITPFFVYYTLARRGLRIVTRIEALGLAETLTHPTWLSFSAKVRAMEASRQEYKANMPCICQNVDCPNRQAKSRRLLRCSACQTSFYCSAPCQRKDWLSHRDKCAIFVSEKSGRRNRRRTFLDQSFISFLLYKEVQRDFTSQADSDDVDSSMVYCIDLSKAETKRVLVPLRKCVEVKGFESVMARIKAEDKGIIIRSIIPNAGEAEDRIGFVPQKDLPGGFLHI